MIKLVFPFSWYKHCKKSANKKIDRNIVFQFFVFLYKIDANMDNQNSLRACEVKQV